MRAIEKQRQSNENKLTTQATSGGILKVRILQISKNAMRPWQGPFEEVCVHNKKNRKKFCSL